MRRLIILSMLLLAVVCLVPTAVHAAQATLTWTDTNPNETGSHIQRKAEACAATTLQFAPLADVGVNVTTYVDTTVQEGNTYCYRVDAFNPAGESGWSNTDGKLIPFTVPKNAPSQLGVTVGP